MARRSPDVRRAPGVSIHPTAIIEPGVQIGARTAVWDHVHLRRGARIGRDCIIGEKTYVAYDVVIGNLVKLNAFVYVCAGVTIEDRVMVAAGAVFTNDAYPRATLPDRTALMTSAPTGDTLTTVVHRGVTIGANATIGPGLELGEFCMVGMGAVVTRDVPPFRIVVGCPAKAVGWVCMCGKPLNARRSARRMHCQSCERVYQRSSGRELRFLPVIQRGLAATGVGSWEGN